jgi:hypothetical protein
MKKIFASEESPTVLSFEDDVLECFFPDASIRLHPIHIQSMELSTDKKGKHLLTIQLKYKKLFIFVDEKPLAEVQELIEQVKLAMSQKGK